MATDKPVWLQSQLEMLRSRPGCRPGGGVRSYFERPSRVDWPRQLKNDKACVARSFHYGQVRVRL